MRLLCASLAALVLSSGAFAQQSPDPRRERELREIEQRLKNKEADEKRLRNEADARAKEVAALRRRMIEAANSLQGAERRMNEITAELDKLAAEEKTLDESLEGEQETLADILAALQSLELSRPPALLVSPHDANRAARAAMLLADAAPVLEARARGLRARIERLSAVRKERDRERVAFEKTREEINSRRVVLAELLQRKQEERDVAATLAAAAQRETAALAARATDIRDVIRRLERLSRMITPRLKPPAPQRDGPAEIRPAEPRALPKAEPFRPARAFSQAKGQIRAPVVGRIITSFGADKPGGGVYESVRIQSAANAIVTAPYEGYVAFARPFGPLGNLIMLDVGGGYHIGLSGVGAVLAQEGQTVAAGEPLAAMPAGLAVLDFEIRQNGEPVNPALWLSRTTMEEASF